jgi:hypothetical protein
MLHLPNEILIYPSVDVAFREHDFLIDDAPDDLVKRRPLSRFLFPAIVDQLPQAAVHGLEGLAPLTISVPCWNLFLFIQELPTFGTTIR